MLDKASGMFNWLFGSAGLVVTPATQLVEIIKDDAIDIKNQTKQIGCYYLKLQKRLALVKFMDLIRGHT